MITYPCINLAHDCLTSVIKCKTFAYKNTNAETSTAVSQKPPTASDEQSLPVMVLHCSTKSIKPKMTTPLMSTNTKTEPEPISLELFNRAAVDLNQKGEIELERYKKYLFNHD